jgi:hypothetical protein
LDLFVELMKGLLYAGIAVAFFLLAVGDVAGMTDELDQTTTVITRGVRGGVIKVSSATAGLSRGISTFLTGEKRTDGEAE